MTDAASMIEVRGLHHAYAHSGVVEPVLHGLDLMVRRGEFVVIMGPSGCGKTTLLNVLGLMMVPTRAATVRIAGRETLGLRERERARLRRETVGFVFQRFNLLPTISVWQNVALPLRIRGQAVDGTVDALLEEVGLSAMARKKPGKLSVGQQQRVALARAVVGNPELLLADEPTGNLDSKNGGAVMDLLKELHAEGATICMVTHDPRYAHVADRAIHLFDGQVVSEDDARKAQELEQAGFDVR
jgi:putative ABC transport system ATP-binding protein